MDKKNCQLVKVYVRQRPFSRQEIDSRAVNIVNLLTSREISVKQGYNEKKYTFDQVFGEEATQLEVYNAVVKPLITYTIAGYNCTVFAYGQTGTGKTHTIIGNSPPDVSTTAENDSYVGMIPRAAANLFSELSRLDPKIEYTVRVSFIEIYNEEVRDLLNGCSGLRVCDDPENKGSVCMKGLTETTVCNVREVYDFLSLGTKERQTAQTNLNTHSSRSHTLFTMLINTREITPAGEELIKTGKLHMVDLAGSENIGRSGATDIRAREAGTINKSLLTLGKVIKALAHKMQHIPYRDSKLTRILQDSLGGNTKTCMIGTISPSICNWDETVSTLDYASTARNVANCPHVNVNRKQANFLRELQDEMGRLRNELRAARTGEGFYVSYDAYEKMTQEQDQTQKRILDLIQQINDLENVKKAKESQNAELAESFERTKEYLDKTTKQLKETDEKVKRHEFILNYMYQRDDELNKNANVLLKVCETSTKHEEIYHSKYERQCNVTLSNANVASDIVSSSIQCLKEIQNNSENFTNKQRSHINEATKATQCLKENHIQNLETMAQLSLDMYSEADKHLTIESALNAGAGNYSENNIEEYLSSVLDEQLELEDHGKIKHSLAAIKDYTLTKKSEMETKSTSCINLVDKESVQNGKYVAVSRNLVEKMHENVCRRNKLIEELLKESLSLQQRSEELLDCLNTYENESLTSHVKESLTDYVNCQSETAQAQLTMIDESAQEVEQKETYLKNQISSAKETVKQFGRNLTHNIKENLNQRNNEIKSLMRNCINKTSCIKNTLINTAAQSTETISKNMDLLATSVGTYSSDLKKFVQESSENIRNMDKKIILQAHAGDTPVRIKYRYPKKIEARLPNQTLYEQYNSNSEDSGETARDEGAAV